MHQYHWQNLKLGDEQADGLNPQFITFWSQEHSNKGCWKWMTDQGWEKGIMVVFS